MAELQLFKVLVDGRSCHGGDHVYVPGEWTPDRVPVLCKTGYHLTSDPLGWWRPGAELWIAEGRGSTDYGTDGGDKGAYQSVRIVERVTRETAGLGACPRLRAFLAASERSLDGAADIFWANLSGADLSGAYRLSGDVIPGWRVVDGRLEAE